ncbi:OLC1v1025548C1 [Oldenlandia corymbosa var. corymbosa]|uniref:OLC1v1025548C1 n=1 Tax=Oldenlandia corymbosa var. corymbosa TaxID=529605 RepID=A0AAV1C5F3_OLDCO|nr:OLC1v1025548C1 [Oldenlandia corymbosa var. corymbosa]
MPGFMDAKEDEYITEDAEFGVMIAEDDQQSEKHISVDPSSLRESNNPLPKTDEFRLPPLPLPTKPKFLSYSLPNSASSSPKFGSMISGKKSRNLNQVSPLSGNFARQDSVALSNLERLRESHLQRSKSYGDGRTSAPPEALDLLMVRSSLKGDNWKPNKIDSFKPEVKMDRKSSYEDEMAEESSSENVKCGALCLFLPGFSKATKPVRPRKEEPLETVYFKEPAENNQGLAVSKRVSLERFECGSWRSSVILDDCELPKEASSNLFYDLPLELIRGNANDTNLPVTTAFVFDKDPKGVLKKSSSRGTSRKSTDRHVRFSTSSPTADDLQHQAREDFNSFLAAQNA